MGPIALAGHLANFALPALVLAVLVALAGRWLMPRRLAGRLGVATAVNFAVGLAVLVAGLAWFGRDGKMATYAALVLAVATSQWLVARGWRQP
jgi:hypothetical protein